VILLHTPTVQGNRDNVKLTQAEAARAAAVKSRSEADARQKKVVTRLADLDDAIVACRGTSHKWPSDDLMPGKALPHGYTPRLMRDGCVEVTEYCRRCRKRRREITLPGGVLDLAADRRYKDPKNWVVLKTDEKISKRMIRADLYRRLGEQIMTAARRNAMPEEETGA